MEKLTAKLSESILDKFSMDFLRNQDVYKRQVFMDAGPNDNKTERQAQCMQKTYVLDANVLIQAPYALESFEDNHIVLPLAVLEELDTLKGADGEAGNNARHVLRFLEKMCIRDRSCGDPGILYRPRENR